MLYCGVEPAALFESRDGGETWSLGARALGPSAPRALDSRAAAGSACTRSCPTPPTAADVHRDLDRRRLSHRRRRRAAGGPRNKGVRADFLPDKHPEFGQCVHKIVRHPRARTALPAEPLGPLPQRRRRRLVADIAQRACPRTSASRWRSTRTTPRPSTSCRSSRTSSAARRRASCASTAPANAAARGSRSTRGLPQQDAFDTVLRDAMAADALRPGRHLLRHARRQLYGSRDEGKRGSEIADGCPRSCASRRRSIGAA